jgi:hypothetical protein
VGSAPLTPAESSFAALDIIAILSVVAVAVLASIVAIRTLLSATFRAGSFTLSLVNVHLYFGSNKPANVDRRCLETRSAAPACTRSPCAPRQSPRSVAGHLPRHAVAP